MRAWNAGPEVCESREALGFLQHHVIEDALMPCRPKEFSPPPVIRQAA